MLPRLLWDEDSDVSARLGRDVDEDRVPTKSRKLIDIILIALIFCILTFIITIDEGRKEGLRAFPPFRRKSYGHHLFIDIYLSYRDDGLTSREERGPIYKTSWAKPLPGHIRSMTRILMVWWVFLALNRTEGKPLILRSSVSPRWLRMVYSNIQLAELKLTIGISFICFMMTVPCAYYYARSVSP